MNSKRSAFIITKPLQYINATNIYDNNSKELYIIPNFNNFIVFFNAIKNKSNIWDSIFIRKTKEIALIRLVIKQRSYSRIYLDSDFGILLRFILFFFLKVKIFVYEEGIASYTNDIRVDSNLKCKVRTFLDKLLLGDTWSGSSYKTVGIYLYHKDVFLKLLNYNIGNKNILSFNKNYLEHLVEIKEIEFLYEKINFNNYIGKDILLYLTAGNINKDVYKILLKYPNFYKILKLHPFHKDIFDVKFDESIDSSLPAELLISKINLLANSIIVVHESSAAILNIINDVKFSDINIGDVDYAVKFNHLRNLINKN
jgi:hypothetical protein